MADDAPRWEGPDGILDRLRPGALGPGPEAGTERYEIRRKIGEGAMADVYEAFDRQLGRRVALKQPKEFALADPGIRARFEREARSSARLSHPHVVQVHDVSTTGAQPFLVMEYIDGQPLGHHLRETRPALPALLEIMEKVARAVQYVHEQGVVHRDLKPGNILVTREGEPKVADFGLAHWLDAEFRLTRSGTPLGTPLYMAPEQVLGDSTTVDPRTDVYALGTILYEAATGRPPHDAKSLSGLYQLILNSDPAPARSVDPRLPADLDRILAQALAKSPERRYPSALSFAEDLGRLRRGEPVLAKPPGPMSRALRQVRRRRLPIAVSLLLAAMAGFGAWKYVESSRRAEAGQRYELARTAFETANRFPDVVDADLAGMNAALDEARRRAEEAAALAPDRPEIPALLGRVWALKGRPDLAEACWRKSIALDPGFGPAHLELGRSLFVGAYLERIRVRDISEGASASRRKRAAELAAEASREIAAAFAARSPVRDDVAVESARAMAAFVAERRDEVTAICDAALDHLGGRPGSDELLWLKAIVLPGRVAKGPMDQAVLKRPGNALYRYSRAIFRGKAGDLAGTFEDYDEAIRREPRFADALHNRGVEHRLAGRSEEALRDLTAALAIDPERESTWGERGGLRYAMGDYKAAFDDLSRAVAIDPTFTKAWNDRAFARYAQGDKEGAIADFSEGLRRDPADAKSWFNRGNLRADMGKIDEALADLDRAAGLQPAWPLPPATRGWIRLNRKEWDAAVADFELALRLAAPDWPDRALVTRGLEQARARRSEH